MFIDSMRSKLHQIGIHLPRDGRRWEKTIQACDRVNIILPQKLNANTTTGLQQPESRVISSMATSSHKLMIVFLTKVESNILTTLNI